MTNNPKNIGETIRANRVRLGYTQEFLANELKVSSQAISKWEKGLNMPDINLLIPLSKALNIGVDQLLGGDRYSELNQAFQKSLKLGDKIALLVCEDALAEIPNDKTFLYRRACSQLFLAKNKTERNLYLNRAIADFERLCKSLVVADPLAPEGHHETEHDNRCAPGRLALRKDHNARQNHGAAENTYNRCEKGIFIIANHGRFLPKSVCSYHTSFGEIWQAIFAFPGRIT